jgi:hypothetical protein
VYWHVPPVPHSRPPGFCGQRRRSSARACQGSVPFVSRWYAAPESTMGEALYTTRSRELNRNDTLQRAPDASRTPGLCTARARAQVPSLYICTCVQTSVLVPSGALYRVALCTEWRFVPGGALYRVALCTEWRFVPSGALYRWRFVPSGALYRVALFGWRFPGLPMWRFLLQKAPHRG